MVCINRYVLCTHYTADVKQLGTASPGTRRVKIELCEMPDWFHKMRDSIKFYSGFYLHLCVSPFLYVNAPNLPISWLHFIHLLRINI